MKKKGGGKLLETFKMSIVSSAGFMIGILPQLLLGMVILLIGVYLVNKDNEKKNNKDKKQEKYGFEFYLGIGLILIGSILSLNMAFGIDFIMDQIN